jgi:hypothetical protein
MNSSDFSSVHLNFIIKYMESTQHARDCPLTECTNTPLDSRLASSTKSNISLAT